MVQRIEGITIELNGDSTQLNDALNQVDSQARRTTRELSQIDRALRFDPGNATLIAQQQEALGDAIRNTSTRLDTLRQAQAEVERQFQSGEINGEQYRRFQRDIEITERQLRQFQDRLSENQRLQIDSSSLGRLRTELRNLGTEAANAGKEIGRGISTGAAGATAALTGLVVGTQELNGDLARLRTNAVVAGVGIDEAESAFTRLYQISGEADSSVEAVSNLLASGFEGETLSGALENIAGAAIRFSDTLNIEGISDGLQETLASGEAIGQFGELLERSQVDVEAFNEGLSKITDEGARTQYALDTLNKLGLTETSELFAKLNPEVAANQTAVANFQLALSKLSLILTPLITYVTELITQFINFAKENPQIVTTVALVAASITALSGAFAILSPIVSAVVGIFPALVAVFGAISAPIALAVLAIGGIVAALVAAYSQSETFRDGVTTVFNAVRDVVVDVFGRVSDFVTERIQIIKDFWDDNGSQIREAFENVFNAIGVVVKAVFPVIQSIIEGVIGAIRNVIDGGLNFILGVVKTFASLFTGDWKGLWEGVKQLLSGAIELIIGVLQLGFGGRIIAVIKKFIDRGLDFFKTFGNGIRTRVDDIVSTVTDRFNKVKDAILKPVQSARDAVKNAIDAIKGFFSGLNLSIPSIKLPKLPRIRIDGDFSLSPPSVPRFEFYAKGGIMTRPTAFGINPNTGSTMVGGEAGAEAILPLNENTLGTIGRAIANTMGNGNDSNITIQAAPIYLDGKLVAEASFERISRLQYNSASNAALTRGTRL